MVLLVVGVRESARFNAVMVTIKLAAVLFFIAVGVSYVEARATGRPSRRTAGRASWPAAAVVFFAYIGFDAVSTTAEEAKNPQRDLPIGIIASLVICTVLYLAGRRVLTGIVPVMQYRSSVTRCRACRWWTDGVDEVPECAGRYALGADRPGLGGGSRRRRARSPASRACCWSCS